MSKEELIKKCNKVKETAGNTIPFHSPEVAPALANELLAIKFEAIRTFVNEEDDFIQSFNNAKETLESLVEYYSMYFYVFLPGKVSE